MDNPFTWKAWEGTRLGFFWWGGGGGGGTESCFSSRGKHKFRGKHNFCFVATLLISIITKTFRALNARTFCLLLSRGKPEFIFDANLFISVSTRTLALNVHVQEYIKLVLLQKMLTCQNWSDLYSKAYRYGCPKRFHAMWHDHLQSFKLIYPWIFECMVILIYWWFVVTLLNCICFFGLLLKMIDYHLNFEEWN